MLDHFGEVHVAERSLLTGKEKGVDTEIVSTIARKVTRMELEVFYRQCDARILQDSTFVLVTGTYCPPPFLAWRLFLTAFMQIRRWRPSCFCEGYPSCTRTVCRDLELAFLHISKISRLFAGLCLYILSVALVDACLLPPFPASP